MRKKIAIALLLFFSIIISILYTAILAQSHFIQTNLNTLKNDSLYVPGELLIKFNDETGIDINIKNNKVLTGISSVDYLFQENSITDIEKVFKTEKKDNNTKKIKTIQGLHIKTPQLFNFYKIKFNEQEDIELLINTLNNDPNILFAEPNFIFRTLETYPDDPLYQNGDQWYIDAVNAPAAWDLTTGDSNQIIGIIDTGIDWDHPDLDDNIWTNWDEIPNNGSDDDGNGFVDDVRGWDFINNDNDPNDDNSHGTHVAGITAAESNNQTGITGIVWKARLMPVKVLQSSGYGTASDLAAGIIYAANNGATIINMSFGNYSESLTVKSALENAYGTAVLVASAGNDHRCLCPECMGCGNMYPACYPFVLGVQASNESGAYTGFTNIDLSGPVISPHPEGFNYEIIAPGQNILSAIPFGGYRSYNGTSMSSAIISGSVALMNSYLPGISNEEIFARLIQGSNNGKINIYGSLTCTLIPELHFIEYTLLDTIAGCDIDGVPDAGETVQIIPSVKNTGGEEYNVTCIFRLKNIQDSSKVHVIDSISSIGDLSTYATLSGDSDPIFLEIDSSVVHNSKIAFEIETLGDNTTPFIYSDTLIIQNAEELTGLLDSTHILTADKLWLVAESFKILSNGTLIINPGTELILDQNFVNNGTIEGMGIPDSNIHIFGPGSIIGDGYGNFQHVIFDGQIEGNKFDNSEYNFCLFQNFDQSGVQYPVLAGNVSVYDCIFRNGLLVSFEYWVLGSFIRCNFYNLELSTNILFRPNYGNNIFTFKYCNFSDIRGHNTPYYPGLIFESIPYPEINFIENNIIYTDGNYSYQSHNSQYYEQLPPQYWGTTKTNIIDEHIWDFWVDPTLAIINYQPILTSPSDSAHGIVWKVLINGIDPQDELLDPLGTETTRFDVYFNRPMDTAYTPILTFGAWEPYTHHIVEDSASWSLDSTIWTAYYNVGLETGDGINVIKVSGARDPEGFEIPPEKNGRFKFIIQAASSASINFTATASIDKVDLEWPPASTPDLLGYNMYRFYKINDSIFSDTIRINSSLITDTTFTDTDIISNTTYYYTYRIVGTDLLENDFSKVVSATPFSASPGDVNGDFSINILDLTTIISYILNQQPDPFIFYAADHNNDGIINILDIISEIDLININKSTEFNTCSSRPVYVGIEEDIIRLNNKDSDLAAIQFSLKVTSKNNPSNLLETIQLKSLIDGFEFSYDLNENVITGIIYSLSQNEIPKGAHDIIEIFGSKEYELSFIEIFGCDYCGNYIPILLNESLSLQNCQDLDISPNPFKNTTTISFHQRNDAYLTINIYDLKGNRINAIHQGYTIAGFHNIEWIGTDDKGNFLPSGIYIVHLEIKTINGVNSFQQYRKVILAR